MGHTSSFSSSLIKKEPVALPKAVPFKSVVSAEKIKACALIGLHLFGSRR